MLDLTEIKRALDAMRIDKAAQATGIGYSTIQQIRSGQQANPRYTTIKALSDYIEQQRV